MEEPMTITPDDVRRVSDFAQEECGHQENEADDVRYAPDRWAEATADDLEAAGDEADEILADAIRVEAVSALIRDRADVVAAILSADETVLRLARLALGVPFPEETK